MKYISSLIMIICILTSNVSGGTQQCCGGVELQAGEVCCGGTPAKSEDCCNNSILPSGKKCCIFANPPVPYDPQTQCCVIGTGPFPGVQAKSPFSDTTSCPGYVSSGTTPSVNGCGTDTEYQFVPQGDITHTVSFVSACNSHDACYGTCNPTSSAKKACDDALANDIKSACNNQMPNVYKLLFLSACKAEGDIYKAAVATCGQSAFNNAQKQACNCCQ